VQKQETREYDFIRLGEPAVLGSFSAMDRIITYDTYNRGGKTKAKAITRVVGDGYFRVLLPSGEEFEVSASIIKDAKILSKKEKGRREKEAADEAEQKRKEKEDAELQQLEAEEYERSLQGGKGVRETIAPAHATPGSKRP